MTLLNTTHCLLDDRYYRTTLRGSNHTALGLLDQRENLGKKYTQLSSESDYGIGYEFIIDDSALTLRWQRGRRPM